MTNDTQPSVKFEGEVDIKRRSTPMTNDTRPSVRPVVGHHAKLRNGVIVPNIRIDPPDTRYWSEAFVTVCTWDENGKSSEYSDFDIIATISPADMQAVASGELERLRTSNEKMKSALAYYADDGPTPNVDGPWNATSWDFGTLARCTLADVANIEGGTNL